VTKENVEMLSSLLEEIAEKRTADGEFAAADAYTQQRDLWLQVGGPADWHALEADSLRRFHLRVDRLTTEEKNRASDALDRMEEAVKELEAKRAALAIEGLSKAHPELVALLGEDSPASLHCQEKLCAATIIRGGFDKTEPWPKDWASSTRERSRHLRPC
jgi:hypothetical protein